MQRRKHFVSVLALVAALAAIVPTVAQTKPTPYAGNDNASNEIPYLSHGIGVNAADFSGSLEIPYLSHGVGVNPEDFRVGAVATQSAISPDDRAVARATPAEPTSIVVTSSVTSPDDRAVLRATPVDPAPIVVSRDSGWSVDLGNSYITALALMLGLLAGGALVAIWSSRRTKLSPA